MPHATHHTLPLPAALQRALGFCSPQSGARTTGARKTGGLKMVAALTTAAAVTLGALSAPAVVPAAFAQEGGENGSAAMSSKPAADSAAGSAELSSTPSPDTSEFNDNENFVPGQQAATLTGSSPLDAGLITGGVLIALKLLIDNVPVLQDGLDQAFETIGLPGSSTIMDFNLERLARTNGMTELADQLLAIQEGSSNGSSGSSVSSGSSAPQAQ